MKNKPLISKRLLFLNLTLMGCIMLVLFWLYIGTVYKSETLHSSADTDTSYLAQNPPQNGNRVTGPTVDINAGDAGTIHLPTTKYSSLADLIAGIMNWVFGFAGGLAVLAIVYSGFMYITTGDDVQKGETARKNLTWAIYGLIFVVSSLLIVNIIKGIF